MQIEFNLSPKVNIPQLYEVAEGSEFTIPNNPHNKGPFIKHLENGNRANADYYRCYDLGRKCWTSIHRFTIITLVDIKLTVSPKPGFIL
jgi:hypothetical protein